MNETKMQEDQVHNPPLMEETVPPVTIWDTEDEFVDKITYTGYEVVRREYFAHLREPSIVLADYKIKLNSASLKKIPDVDYVQMLVNQETKKLAARPCREEDKDSICIRTPKGMPRAVTGRLFIAKLFTLMGWNPEYKYKILGKLVQGNDDAILLFDLNAPQIFKRVLVSDGKRKTSRTPIFPEEWKNQFGLPVEEHARQLSTNQFSGFTVFGIKEDPGSGEGETNG